MDLSHSDEYRLSWLSVRKANITVCAGWRCSFSWIRNGHQYSIDARGKTIRNCIDEAIELYRHHPNKV